MVSGQNDEVLDTVAELYDNVIDAGVHRAPSMEVAEAGKVVENVQRDVNIALVNELAMVFDEIGLDTREVIEAAGTKWNFHEYEPGLVSGHCIPVDPYFLTYQARRSGYAPDLIRVGREVNESIADHVADLVVQALNESGTAPSNSRILVLGLTYKPDVADVRSSKIGDVLDELSEYDIEFEAYDPYAPADVAQEEFGVELQDTLTLENFDGVLLATPHEAFTTLSPQSICTELNDTAAIVDVDAVFDRADVPDSAAYRRL
ncbi:nucleotide sugar dehydrogenase [Haloarculaceae archaeon H-GB2-1]|nr:nucleotide sugar dehydrogenase [Haloarculaceae archaeon H-GB2-1]